LSSGIFQEGFPALPTKAPLAPLPLDPFGHHEVKKSFVISLSMHKKSQEIAIGDNDNENVFLLSSGHQMRHE
jgi:hypothetical protein